MSEKTTSETRAERERRRAAEYMSQVEVGSIFVSQWGYDQTNVDFYQVTRKTAKTVVLRAIRSASTPAGWCQADVTPVPGDFEASPSLIPAEGKRCKVLGYSDRPMVSLNSYANAYLWDGRPERETSWA